MNRLKIGCYLFLMITLSFYSVCSFAQDIKSLENQILNSKKEIEKAEQMIRSNKNKETTNVEKLSLIRSQMQNRQKIVSSMNKQRDIVERNIGANNSTVRRLQEEFKQLRKEYGDMMVMGYKNYLFSNSLLFLFAAKDFNELQMRIFYIRRVSNLRYQLSLKIDAKAEDITVQSDSLKVKKKELEVIVSNTKKEITSLDSDSKRYNETLAAIKQDRKKLYADVKKNQNNIRKLQSKIQAIIAEEARKERERQRMASKETKDKYVAESGEFAKFKGNMISPCAEGIVIERFGTHPHPIQKNITVDNKGVNFQVPENSSVRTVFDGVVTKIFFLQGLNNSVMVRHGEYITTYSGLTEVTVQMGDVVKKGQSIGKITGNSRVLHFELWKGTTNLNPETWVNM
ncbi:MAG: peptidoglycan DD-metalloendopeptidase family protein [Rikenellaceae bacterium]